MLQTAQYSSTRTEGTSHRSSFEAAVRDLTATEAVLVSTLPRGGLQIVQPQRVAEALVKAYGREFQTEDHMSWTAITTGKAVRANSASRYVTDFLQPFGYQFAAAAPLKSPVFEGYPGALQVFRTAEQGDFSDADLKKLMEMAQHWDAVTGGTRSSRAGAADGEPAWGVRPDIREIIFDAQGNIRAFAPAFDALDERIRHQMKQEVHQRLARDGEEPVVSERVLLPDSAGDYWAFNAVLYRGYPALGKGAFVFFTMLPSSPEWDQVRPADFQADPELSRLLPALRFMQSEYHRGPTLVEIAKTLQLSPFHFHRRFTELLGLTPKHFLLECQIHEAKTQLVAGTKELSKLAADCGFAHQSHFTSRFKQTTGLTPTRWRRMALERVAHTNGHGKRE